MKKPSMCLSVGRTPGKMILFAFSVCMIICLTGYASAVDEASLNSILKLDGYESIDPGFSLFPSRIDIDPDFILPPSEIDVDPSFSISRQSDEITVVPYTDDSIASSDTYSIQNSTDSVVINPQS